MKSLLQTNGWVLKVGDQNSSKINDTSVMILGCMAGRLERRLKHCTLHGGHSGYSLRLVLALHPTTAASGYSKEQLSL